MKTFRIETFNKDYVKVIAAETIYDLIHEHFPRYDWSYNSIKGKAYVSKRGNVMDCYFIEEVCDGTI